MPSVLSLPLTLYILGVSKEDGRWLQQAVSVT